MSRVSMDLVERFARVRLLLVGDLLADHYLYGQTERVSREAPVLIVRQESDEVQLGGGGNAAANARALGAKVTAVGVVGRDAMGAELTRLCRARGIVLKAVSGPGLATETRTRVLAGGVSTTRQQMLRIDRGATGPLPAPVRKALARTLEVAARSADVVMVSDYAAGVLCDETRAALRRVAKRGVPVCVDSRFALATMTGFAVCKPNEPELAALTGLPVRTDAEVVAAGKAALRQLRCDVLLVTRGRRGMMLFEPGARPVAIPVHGADEAVDVTGAGDTVGAALAVALGAGASPLEAASLANVAGALAVAKPGTATVTSSELRQELAR
ncbi:MAG: PfkB family carbohydrate kinase [Myxococcota bacterium]|jgi:rfaE bifunctional protein kinase chain/domain